MIELPQKKIEKILELASKPEYKHQDNKYNNPNVKIGNFHYSKIAKEAGCSLNAVKDCLNRQKTLEQKAMNNFRIFMDEIDIIEDKVLGYSEGACKIIYKIAKKQLEDPESLFHNPELVRNFVGTSCRKYEKMVK